MQKIWDIFRIKIRILFISYVINFLKVIWFYEVLLVLLHKSSTITNPNLLEILINLQWAESSTLLMLCTEEILILNDTMKQNTSK